MRRLNICWGLVLKAAALSFVCVVPDSRLCSYPGGKTPSTFWVGQPRSNSGNEENRQTKTAAVHNLLAPLTDRFNRRITTPPRMVPSTATGIQTPPGVIPGEKVKSDSAPLDPNSNVDEAKDLLPIIMLDKETVWLNCFSMNLAMKVARPANSAAWLTWARITSR